MASSPPPTPRPGELFRLAAWVYLLLAIAGVAWIGVQRHGVDAALFLPAGPWWVDPLAGAGAALALVLGWRVVRALALARRLEQRLRERLGVLTAAEAWGLALLSGVGEEVFFRGAVQGAWGYPAATLLFAVLHSGRGREMLLWTASAVVAGAVLGGLLLWRGTLFAPILCHALVNGLQLHRLLVDRRPAPSGSGA